MKKKLNILVFDDSLNHRRAAEQTLKGHNLTIVGTYDEAEKALSRVTDWDTRTITYPKFDVVMTDLLVPASARTQGPDGIKHVGKEAPLGAIIALLAIKFGIKKVAVVTDMNHHAHPASAALDVMNGATCQAEGLNLICTNHVYMVSIDEQTGELVNPEFLESDKGKAKYPYLNPDQPWGNRKGILRGKDWSQVLAKLMGDESSTDAICDI